MYKTLYGSQLVMNMLKHQSKIIQEFGCIWNFVRKLLIWFSKSKASVQKGPKEKKRKVLWIAWGFFKHKENNIGFYYFIIIIIIIITGDWWSQYTENLAPNPISVLYCVLPDGQLLSDGQPHFFLFQFSRSAVI